MSFDEDEDAFVLDDPLSLPDEGAFALELAPAFWLVDVAAFWSFDVAAFCCVDACVCVDAFAVTEVVAWAEDFASAFAATCALSFDFALCRLSSA